MNEQAKDGGPAFPFKYTCVGGSNRLDGTKVPDSSTENYIIQGMSLRDWFAGMALNGLVNRDSGETLVHDLATGIRGGALIAGAAYVIADQMLEQRSK